MTEERTTALFFEMFTGLPRQGPGDDASTLKALTFVGDLGAVRRVLDLGCGTGRQTLALATACPAASVVGIDSHRPFIETATQEAGRRGLASRVEFQVGDMGRLDAPSNSADLVWSEGAVYILGFEVGLQEWRRLLAPGGHLVVSEACWMKPDAPAQCVEFWMREYPAIREVGALLSAVDACGYDTVGHFSLPAASWWTDYYHPLQRHLVAFRARHEGEADAQDLADQVQLEIDIWQRYSEFYSYEFLVMRGR